MTELELEKIIIKMMFTNKIVREKIFPFLDDKIFGNKDTKKFIELYKNFHEEYNKFPTGLDFKSILSSPEEIDFFINDVLKINTADYTEQYLFDNIENFFKKRLIHNNLIDMEIALEENKIADVSKGNELIRESLAFNFDAEVGLDVLESAEKIYEALISKDKVVSTGIPLLDIIMEGGYASKTLSVWMANSNLGKSTILASLASYSILHNKSVLIVSWEMTDQKYARRIVSNILDVHIAELKYMNKDSFLSKFESVTKNIKTKLIIKQYSTKSTSTNHVRSLLAELKLKKNFVPDIILLDYLQIMASTHPTKNDNTYSECKKISEDIRGLAIDMDVPIVSAIQTVKSAIGAAELSMKDISQSIGIGETVDLLIGLTQPEEFKEQRKVIADIIKNRDGEKDIKIILNMDFTHMRVTEDIEANEKHKNDKKPIDKTSEAIKQVQDIIKKDDDAKKQKTVNWSNIKHD